MLIIFLMNVKSFIGMWSYPLVKNKNEPSIPSITVRFSKLCSHTSLKKEWNWRRNPPSTTIMCIRILSTVFLTKHGIEVMEHSPCSTELAPCDFWLFLCEKSALQGSRFDTNEAVVAAVKSQFSSMDSSEFTEAWVNWRERWDKCTGSGDRYWKRVYRLIHSWSWLFVFYWGT